MKTNQQELLVWASQFVPPQFLKKLDFSDGVCYAYIIRDAFNKSIELFNVKRWDEKLQNLEFLQQQLLKFNIPITFDIGKLIINDTYAKFKLLEDLRYHYNSIPKSQKPKSQHQDNQNLIQSQTQMSSNHLDNQSEHQEFYSQPSYLHSTPNKESRFWTPDPPQTDPLEIISNLPFGACRTEFYGNHTFLRAQSHNQSGFQITVDEPLQQSKNQQENLNPFTVSKSIHNQINSHQKEVLNQHVQTDIENVMKKLIQQGLGQQIAQFHADMIYSTIQYQDVDLIEYQRNFRELIQFNRQNTQNSTVHQGGDHMNQSQQQARQKNYSKSNQQQENHEYIDQNNIRSQIRQSQDQSY